MTVAADGTTRPIQDLRIADRVFDPVSGADDEIVDILARRISVSSSERLRPLTLSPDAVGPGCPIRSVILSPAQIVMLPVVSAGSDCRRHLVESLASNVPRAVPASLKEAFYFAVFFERPRFIDVSGICARAYTLEDISHVGNR